MKDFFLGVLRKVTNDKLYYQIRYIIKHKTSARISDPQSFSSKLIWLNLYDRNPFYNTIVDKYEVRQYIRERIGDKYLNEAYGVYERAEDIDFEKLPDQFVVKATHGSGWIVVCDDKSKLDIVKARKTMNGWLKQNFYDLWGEWVYKDLKPRLIVEKFLKNENESGLTDYKFYCFNGVIRFIQVDMDRFESHTRTYFDTKWDRIQFELGGCRAKEEPIQRPVCLDEMIEITNTLNKGFRFIRVDLYEVQGKVYFGELTLYSGNGMLNFNPKSIDMEVGSYLQL